MVTLCAVCNFQASKYKCPSCQIPYCSIKCYQTHQILHLDETSTLPSLPTDSSLPKSPALAFTNDPTRQDVRCSFTSSSTVATGGEVTLELQRLDDVFPQLRNLLHQIYSATLKPHPDEAEGQPNIRSRFSRGGRRGRGHGHSGYKTSEPQWTQGRGRKNGLYLLRKWRGEDGGNGDALKAFSGLISEQRENLALR